MPGHAYFLADDGKRTIRSFLTALARTAGVDLPSKSMPRAVARAAAKVVEGSFRLARAKSKPPMTSFAIDMLSSTITVKTERARRELGWSPVISVEDGLRDLAAGEST